VIFFFGHFKNVQNLKLQNYLFYGTEKIFLFSFEKSHTRYALEKNAKKTSNFYFFHFLEKRPLDIFGHFFEKCALFSEKSLFFGEKKYYMILVKNIFKK